MQAQVGKTFWLHCVRLKQSSNTTSPIWSLWWTCVRLGARPRRPVQITKFLWWMMWMASQWLFNMSHWLQTSWAWSLLHAPEQRGWPAVQSSRKLRRLGRLARKDSATIPTVGRRTPCWCAWREIHELMHEGVASWRKLLVFAYTHHEISSTNIHMANLRHPLSKIQGWKCKPFVRMILHDVTKGPGSNLMFATVATRFRSLTWQNTPEKLLQTDPKRKQRMIVLKSHMMVLKRYFWLLNRRLGGGNSNIFMFTPIWGRFRFWLIFFRWVETTNQLSWGKCWYPWDGTLKNQPHIHLI